jgi:hypothetical protein
LSDHRIRTACDHNDAFLVRRAMPGIVSPITQNRSHQSYLAGLVLRDFMLGVLSALLALAVCASGLGNVDL